MRTSMRYPAVRAAARRGFRSVLATAGRGLPTLAAVLLATPGLAQWKSDLQACGAASLSPEQRIEACTRSLASEKLTASDRAATYNNLGVAWKAKGEVDQAIASYDRAIAVDPRFANAYGNRGAAFGAKGDLDSAMRDFNRALELDPKLAQAHENRGLARESRGDLDGAIQDLDEAIRLEPHTAMNYVERAGAWQAKGDLVKATADLNEAIRLQPDSEQLFVFRGLLWDRQRDYTRSIADYDEAIRLNPLSAVAYNNRCNTWLIKEAYDRAADDCAQAEKLDPDLAKAHFNRGVLWTIANDYARARDEFDQVIRLNPRFAPAYKSRAALSFYGGQFDAAQADLEQAAGLFGYDPYVAIWRYLAQARAGHAEAAARDLAQSSSGNRDTAWPAPVVGLYLDRGDPGSVFRTAQQGDARAQGDQQCEAAFYVGEWHLLHGEKGQALRFFEDAQRNCRKSFSESGGARAELDRLSR
jgi:tetratricopeptide (TPR) repeat protein